MRLNIILIVLSLIIVGCSSSQADFISLRQGDNIRLEPNPVIIDGKVSLVDNPEISNNLTVSGFLILNGLDNLTLDPDESSFLCISNGTVFTKDTPCHT